MGNLLSSPLRTVIVWFIAFVNTMLLFLVMKIMVTGQDYNIEDAPPSITIDMTRLERDEEVNSKDRAQKRPTRQEPDEPPPPPKLDSIDKPKIDDANAMDTSFMYQSGGANIPVDGDALAIVRVPPRYPNRALSRGVEGWVLLEFTINEVGQAVDIFVVEAEPATMFNRSAMNAVRKWKYRPKTEDGRAVPRPGVQQLITYQIAE
ncbi:MAG: energy transducer TonB [Parvibaculales bacterium]